MRFLIVILAVIFGVDSFAHMPKDEVLKGFVVAQKAPQMAGPVPYLPKSYLFHGKRGKLKDGQKAQKKGKSK